MPKALSATVPEPLEARAREIARRENRSLSNVVENALGVFTALPKDLRDQLVARLSTGGPDDVALREAAREMMFALARRRYEEARDAWLHPLGVATLSLATVLRISMAGRSWTGPRPRDATARNPRSARHQHSGQRCP